MSRKKWPVITVYRCSWDRKATNCHTRAEICQKTQSQWHLINTSCIFPKLGLMHWHITAKGPCTLEAAYWNPPHWICDYCSCTHVPVFLYDLFLFSLWYGAMKVPLCSKKLKLLECKKKVHAQAQLLYNKMLHFIAVLHKFCGDPGAQWQQF